MSFPYSTVPRGQRIFISYRRSDCQAQANGLHDGLIHRLPQARVFMDIDSIPAGVDFEQHIRAEIDACDVVLVLIGDNWLDARPGTKTRRIDEPNDFVRLEIESALASDRVRTIPVLVEGAQMPDAQNLPESIRRLSRINAFELDDRRWSSDLHRITRLLEELRNDPTASLSGRPQPVGYQPPPPAASYGSMPIHSVPMPPRAQSALPPQTWTPPPAQFRGPTPYASPQFSQPRESKAGWIVAALPVLCCGLAAFAPGLRAGIIRPHQRWPLFGAAAVLEVLALSGFVMVGVAPTDEEGTATGVLANLGVAMLLLSTVVAVIVGIVFRNPAPASAAIPRINLNALTADALAQQAGIPYDEAQRVVSQRTLIGRFTSVEQAISGAEVSPVTATRLREVATV